MNAESSDSPSRALSSSDPAEADVNVSETVTRVLGIVARRRWYILLGFCVTALVTSIVLYVTPNRYTSEATILVVQQQVPERYVIPTSTTDISKALQGMKEQVLSRTQLLAIIEDLGLYPQWRKRLAPEALVNVIRKDVSIAPLESNPERREINAFRISFVGDDPRTAQEVTSRLTTLFIRENLKSREDQATLTTKFLQEQLDSAKALLTEKESALRDFKMQFLGELPEQQIGNLGILAGLQTQLQNTLAALSRAQQQRLYIESLLTQQRRPPRRPVITAQYSGPMTPLEQAERDLKRLQAERAELLDRYSPKHPDVLLKDHDISRRSAEVERLRTFPVANTPESAADTGETIENENTIAQLNSQLQGNTLEMQELSKTEERLKAEVDKYHARINMTPVREQQLSGLLRDYELLKQNYSDLLSKKLQSQLATTLEKRQEGQQFRLVDPPSFPTIPSSPKRTKISLGGLAAGILMGLALAFAVEMKDSSLHTEADCVKKFAVPVVVGVPLLLTASERRNRICWRAAEWLCGFALLAAVCAAEAYVIRLN